MSITSEAINSQFDNWPLWEPIKRTMVKMK